jgi:trimeric autotransporter adhesin
MKKLFTTNVLPFLVAVIFTFSYSSFSQTNPVVQELPYFQDFTNLSSTSIVYPDGFQGWTASTSPGNTFNTSATPIADRALTPSSTAATNTGNIHNYNGKIGFQNTGSLDLTLVFAFRTIGKLGIEVTYDAMTIRNPYDASNTRISEMVLQYRTNLSSAFITLPATAYVNNMEKQTTGTNPQQVQTIKVVLPADCNNQETVQIRWISKQNSGSGSRPSFAIDNLNIKNDDVPPIYLTDFPKISEILSDGFMFSSQLNESGKTYFVVLPFESVPPTISQIKQGLDASDAIASSSGVLSIVNANTVYAKNVSGLTIDSDYTIFSVSEDYFGTTQINSIAQNVKTANAPVASISTSVSQLDFDFTTQNYESDILNYRIQLSNSNAPVNITVSENFSIAKNPNDPFLNALVLSSSDFDTFNASTIYVRFKPNTTGVFSGQILNESIGAAAKTITLSGSGINPYNQDFNDVNILTNSGWKTYSIAGNTINWASTSTRFNSAPRAVQINGFSENGASNDWLISPKLQLNDFDAFPLLSFYSRKFFSGPNLKVLVSTNYDGKSSPETATWNLLEADFPTTTGTFKLSEFINLQAYKTASTYIAWVYETTNSGSNNAAEWTIDDVNITNTNAFLSCNPTLNFGEIAINTNSPSQSFLLTAGGYGTITVIAPADYQLSTDSISFTSNIILTQEEALQGKIIYARFVPSTETITISGSLLITGDGLSKEVGLLTGSSLPKTSTFDVVSYNLEFFGSNIVGSDGREFGPTNDALQIDNVAKVVNTLNADVYALQEVSDDSALDSLIEKISVNGKTFDKSISPAWSYSFNAPEPDFPPQKLVVVYNTQTTKIKKSRVLFSELYDAIRSGKTTLPNYPAASDTFFSSGRLPQMVDVETTIGGIKKEFKIINIHARANSGSDLTKYNQRKYDVEVLKDSLDVHYPNSNFMIIGDYNDDVKASVIANQPSSYRKMVEDVTNYKVLTLEISQAGAFSFLSSESFLDHITVSNELVSEYIPNSIQVYDPRIDIPNYINTTSDHAPVTARFMFKDTAPLAANSTLNADLYLKIFPNPTKDVLNVSVNSDGKNDLFVKLSDVYGREIGTPQQINSSSNAEVNPINMDNLNSGIYFLSVIREGNVIKTEKIVRE